LGSDFLWVDYTLPLEEIRKALKEIIEPNPLWDKHFWNLQVTDATEKTMQIRVLATSADSSKGWDLRCDIRE
ncbi:MAG: mechanosensitive ion channel family protein, partial [Terriglobales bacterium]